MAWIESHQSLRDHPKVRNLAKLLNADLDSALGKLHRFWYWVVDYAEDGDLQKYGMDLISDSLGYDSKALIEAHWVDLTPYLRVHDWWDHSGRFFQSKYKNCPEKWQRIKSLYLGGSKELLTTGHIPTYLPTDIPTIPPGAFDSIWNRYPRREGRKEAERHFKASVRNIQDWLDIENAMESYLQKLRKEKTEPQFVKMGSTWFNNWRDWVGYNGVILPKAFVPPVPPKIVENEVSEEERQEGLKALAHIKTILKPGAVLETSEGHK